MRQRKKNITFKVGVFVFAGVVCLFAYTLLLGTNRTYFSLAYKYKVQFSSVDGLFSGSVVKVNGVPAGNVVDIEFIRKTGEVRVVVSVLRDFAPALTDKAFASLATKGLLGDKYIAIITRGDQQGQRLKKGDYIPTQPAGGLLGVLNSSAGGDKIKSVLDELAILIKSLNSEKTVRQISKTAGSISNMFSESQSRDLSRMLKRINSILTKLDEGEGTVGALINNKNLYHRVLGLLGRRPYHKYLPALVDEQNKR